LVVQGGTLGPLLRWLRLEDDGSVIREVQVARAETARSALSTLHATDAPDLVALLRRKYEARLRRADSAHPEVAVPEGDGMDQYLEALRRAQAAERQTLFDLRARGVIGDDAFHRVEEELDWAELGAQSMSRSD